MGMGIQQPPKKQVAKQKEKKETTATMVTLNARFQLWKVLIRNNHQSVCPWSMTTNGADRRNKKALPWQPQRSRISQMFRTCSPDNRPHYGRCLATATMNGDLSPNSENFEYQAGFVTMTMESRAVPRQPQMATVRRLTWKGVDEIQVNDLHSILSLIEKQEIRQTD